MNKKGFAVSGIIYTILLVFVLFLTMMLYNLQDRKTILDEIKADAVKAVEEENTLESLQARIELLEDDVKLFIKTHPVGSIYVTVATDEATAEMMNTKYEGSTWEAYGEGKTMIGVGTGTDEKGTTRTFSVEDNSKNLGEYEHELSIEEMPNHNHKLEWTTAWAGNSFFNEEYGGAGGYWHEDTYFGIAVTHAMQGTGFPYTLPASSVSTATISNTGNGKKHNNVQPYVTVYMYRRTA